MFESLLSAAMRGYPCTGFPAGREL